MDRVGTRQVTLVVPFPPGGSNDVAARAESDPLSRALGRPVVVENRGGGRAVGTAEVAHAKPDGHTILFGANAITLLHLATKNLPYDTLRDFVAVTQVTTQPNAIAVHPFAPGKFDSGTDRVRQSQSGKTIVRASRRGHEPASHRGAALEIGRREVDRCAVPRRWTGDQEPRWRLSSGCGSRLDASDAPSTRPARSKYSHSRRNSASSKCPRSRR
jgi:tripartite-type tricarboxylate transporter receptor subunit TctC